MVNIGGRPTFPPEGDGEDTVEVHVVGYEGDLYDRHIEVTLFGKLRDERRFDSAAALAAQIERDVETLIERATKDQAREFPTYKADLERKIEMQEAEFDQLLEAVRSDALKADDTEKRDALDTLEKIKKKFEAKKQILAQYYEYETALGLNHIDMPIVKTMAKEYNVRFALWNMR